MFLNTVYTDPKRRFWIDDNLPGWGMVEGKLTYRSYLNSQIDVDGISPNDTSADGKVIYLGDFLNIWGHCITDNLKRIWYLKTEEGKKLVEMGYKIVCTSKKAKSLSKAFIELLAYIGINGNEIQVVSYGSKYKEIIVPEDCFTVTHQYYKEYKDIIDEIRNKIPIRENSYQKVYFSRSKLKNGRDFGEGVIENLFVQLGYKIIYPETLPLKEQLEILRNCKCFAATEGSVSHVAMFCSDGVKCTIVRKTVSLNGYQFSVNMLRNLDVTYLDAHASLFRIFDGSYGPFLMYVNENVVSFAKDHGLEGFKVNLPRNLLLIYLVRVLYLSVRFRIKPLLVIDFDFYLNRIKKDCASGSMATKLICSILKRLATICDTQV